MDEDKTEFTIAHLQICEAFSETYYHETQQGFIQEEAGYRGHFPPLLWKTLTSLNFNMKVITNNLRESVMQNLTSFSGRHLRSNLRWSKFQKNSATASSQTPEDAL